MGNETVASVSSVGFITAKELGVSNLTGAVQASDPQIEHTVIYSKVSSFVFFAMSFMNVKQKASKM